MPFKYDIVRTINSPADVKALSVERSPSLATDGRKAGYIDDGHFRDDSGYTNPEESVNDFFNVGHTSTSIALALGDFFPRGERLADAVGKRFGFVPTLVNPRYASGLDNASVLNDLAKLIA